MFTENSIIFKKMMGQQKKPFCGKKGYCGDCGSISPFDDAEEIDAVQEAIDVILEHYGIDSLDIADIQLHIFLNDQADDEEDLLSDEEYQNLESVINTMIDKRCGGICKGVCNKTCDNACSDACKKVAGTD